jgi:HK97 gp10 family phage protein
MPRIGGYIEFTKNGNPLEGAAKGALEGVKKTAEFVITNAKALAPVDQGRLRASLHYKLANNQTYLFNKDGKAERRDKISITPPALAAYAGTNAFYGVYQEFGTSKQGPQPYLRPAGALARGESVGSVIKKIQQEEMNGALKKGTESERVQF